ncbi:MAG: hypothetical protein FIB07_17060 [Candidatus Methanoperedens sp.]|nr:hypothetical protein [Candidatus Methanoperedens sp.]
MTKLDTTNIQHSEEPNLEEEKNIEPVALPAKNELQAIENQLENSSIQKVNTQPDNKKVDQESEPISCEATPEIQEATQDTTEIVLYPVAEIPQQEQSKTPKITQVQSTEELVQTPVEATQAVEAEQQPLQMMQEPEAIQDSQRGSAIVNPETIPVAEPIIQVTAPTETIPEQVALQSEVTRDLKCEITTTLVIITPKTTPSNASPAKKKPVETVLQRVKVPASNTYKTWPSRSFDLPGGKPSTVYHENGTTIVTASGYHEAPGFKSEDIDKLRNEPAEDVNKMVKESFRCQLGFIKAYFQNLREHPELPW